MVAASHPKVQDEYRGVQLGETSGKGEFAEKRQVVAVYVMCLIVSGQNPIVESARYWCLWWSDYSIILNLLPHLGQIIK